MSAELRLEIQGSWPNSEEFPHLYMLIGKWVEYTKTLANYGRTAVYTPNGIMVYSKEGEVIEQWTIYVDEDE